MWRSWSAANPCPACGGHRWSGESSQQCAGGYDPDRSEVRVWCSIEDSGKPSASGRTFEWSLDAPYPWVEDKRPTSAGFSERASTMPGDLYKEGGWTRTARWIYRTQDCSYAFEVVRFDHQDSRKTYRPGRAVKDGGKWVHWGLPREARIPYQLPRMLAAISDGLPVYIVEGEKSADAINAIDIPRRYFTATTLPGGSSQWGSAPNPHHWFKGAHDVHIVVDRDAAGLAWARDVIASLRQLKPWPRIQLLQSCTTDSGDDVVEHLAAGFALKDLQEFNHV